MLLASPVFVSSFFFFIFSPAREAFFGPDFGSSDSDPSKLLTSHSPLGSLCLRAHYEKCQTNNKTEDVRSAEAQGEEESLQRLLGWCCWFLLLLLLWELQRSRVATGRWKLCKRKSKLFLLGRGRFFVVQRKWIQSWGSTLSVVWTDVSLGVIFGFWWQI